MRYITKFIEEDLSQKMVFIGGPRQCGKTTVAKNVVMTWGSNPAANAYFNWDSDIDRKKLLRRQWPPNAPLIALDEIHKYARWKNWVKGLHDTLPNRFLVTASARLDVYRRGGDSMLGRYHHWRLHPLSLSEIPDGMAPAEALKRLLTVGGFPEPFLKGDVRFARRWRRDRFERVLRDDVRDLEHVQDITRLEMLVDALRSRVGGLVVAANLASDLEVAPKTVQRWIELLDRMYLIFPVRPYTHNLDRAIRKPLKVYFYDNGDVEGDAGTVFKNLVASHLLKRIQFLEDRDGDRYELRYLRDKSGREVDFVVLKNKKVLELWESKHADETVSSALRYYAEKLKPKKTFQVVSTMTNSFMKSGVHVLGPIEAFASLE
jgi:uncharacterized protein